MIDKNRDYHTVIIDRVQAAIVVAAYAIMIAALSAAIYYGVAAYWVLLRLAGG